MSEHRRKMPPQQPPTGGRAAARRAAQQPGHRSAPAHDVGMEAPSASYGPPPPAGEEPRPYGGRAEARRAAQRGGRRRGADAGPGGGRGGSGGGGRRGGGGGSGPGRGSGGGRPPGRKRLIDYPRYGKRGWRRWMPSWKLVTGTFMLFVGVLMGGAFFAYSAVEIPKEDATATSQNNIYYWADGSRMIATGSGANRQIVGIEQIPRVMQEAVVSAENKTFWDDSGIDPMGIGRAVWNMAKGGETQGGSTITQQYVKNNRLNDQSQTVSRKVKELFISMKVGNKLEKRDIMAGYLNTAYYGRGAYGIQAAARAYFDKDAKDLNASEAALLASVLKGATYYDPGGYPEIDPEATPEKNLVRATKRWKWILNEMVKDQKISAEERAKYTTFPKVKQRKQDAQLTGQIGYLVSTAKGNFISNNTEGIGAKELERGGYEIYTTFQKPKVQALEKSVTKILDEHIDPEKRPKTDTDVQFGGATVDTATGAIVALYGGVDATKHFTNNADPTGAQVGSTFKPFVLAAAMKYGVRDKELGPAQDESTRTIVDPDKSLYSGQDKLRVHRYNGDVWHDEKGKEWLQTNDDGASYGNITLREAMIHSANSPYVQLGMDVGIDKVRESAVAAGLRQESLVKGESPSFSLGTSSPSAIRMAGAYATFANKGQQNEPFSVTKVVQGGKTIYEHKAQPKSAFSPAIASNVTDVLRDVVEDPQGTGRKAAIPGRAVAGKTGTTDGNKSAWFVGYTAQLSTAIDMYRFSDDDTKTDRVFEEMYGTGDQPKIHGSSFPSRIWKDYMTTAVEGMPLVKFPEPMDLENAEPVFGGGATSPTPSPTPTPTPTPTESAMPTTTPPATPTTTPPVTKTPKPGKTTCDIWDWECNHPGDPGGDTGGPPTTAPETESPQPTDTPTDDTETGPGPGNGNGNGSGSGGPGKPGGNDGSWVP
ncbi:MULTISPECIES: transglycosylase domain-containing protein [unclassified Streptomyces]|uniref:transglycosylase domain-containing protein n=1 Tax=unclassified Streptomyces TaxID=2593676 RepID=UPI001CB7062C|nr:MULTISPECIES: transglycosylase domain-containing protein [unclassified Streptomyces]MBD0708574.1 penicillin-binding protein [Streptomyces sp. CBMA291]MBD0712825.1 penicillin-binding protein [Streptomyces sp. CBMA370]